MLLLSYLVVFSIVLNLLLFCAVYYRYKSAIALESLVKKYHRAYLSNFNEFDRDLNSIKVHLRLPPSTKFFGSPPD